MNLLNIVITSNRLQLVPISMEFVEEIFKEFSPDITTFMYPAPAKKIETTIAFIANSLKGLREGSNLQLVILDIVTKEFIGCAGLHKINDVHPELGIWIKKSSHGHAYGLEAITAIVQWARENVEYEYLKYPVDKRNYASKRIPEHLGGHCEKEYILKNMEGKELEISEYWLR